MARYFMFTILLAAFIALPAAALADFNTGDNEITLSGSGSSDEDFDTTTLSVEGSWGYFFSPVLEGIVRQGFSIADQPGDNDWNGSTRLGVDYHFPLERFIPYVGASLGYIYGDGVEESFIAGPDVGLKTFVNDTTFVLLGAEYQFLFDDVDEADNAFDDGRFVYTLGLGYRW